MKLLDRFTTQHGSWDVNPNKPYGIDEAHRIKYEAGRLIPGAGGDHHIFVNSAVGNFVEFYTEDGNNYKAFHIPVEGWLNFPIFAGAKWHVAVNQYLVAKDIELPGGEHVSTFLVVGEDEPVPQPPSPGQDHYVLYRNGAVVYDSEE